jgi:hypothetical protein
MIEIIKKSAEDPAKESRDENNRVAQRRRQLKAATLIVNNVDARIECRLRDISDTGAGVECENAAAVPDFAMLKLADGRIYDCEVAWRGGTRIGLRFRTNTALQNLQAHLSAADASVVQRVQAVIDLAESAVRGEQGVLGRPELSAELKKLANEGQQLRGAIIDLLQEYGGPGTGNQES